MNDHRSHYWRRHTDGTGAWMKDEPAPGADLAAMRRGIGREPGDIPGMWPFYTTLDPNGLITTQLWAEHVALTLFAVHQQSLSKPVHRSDVDLGTALRALRNDGKFSPEAVDRRFAAAATATSRNELAHHLRGLVTQLRGLRTQPGLDYTRLFRDLHRWQFPDGRARVRRRWGARYFAWEPEPDQSGSAPHTA